MNRFLITALLACSIGTAMAQSAPPASTDPNADANKDVVTVQDKRPVNRLCLQTGTMIKQNNVDNRSAKATDCATASPGHAYNRDDIDRTGAMTTSGALQELDPSIQIRHH